MEQENNKRDLSFLTENQLMMIEELRIFENEDLIGSYLNANEDTAVSEDLALKAGSTILSMNLEKLAFIRELDLGVFELIKGYLEYAEYVLVNRALPNLYDGLKPVQRYVVYRTALAKGSKQTSSNIVTAVMKDHPHGDASVYKALVRMTSDNGSFMVPPIEGLSNFGKYYQDGGFAAMRYTSVAKSYNTGLFLDAQEAIEEELSSDLTYKLPVTLSPLFPFVLCASAAGGIGVGDSTLIPTYNVDEVADLVTEYVSTGDMETIIYPDFVSGCEIVKDTSEYKKILSVGRGRLRLRGKVEIEKTTLNIYVLPEGITDESYTDELYKLKEKTNMIKTISNYSDSTGLHIAVICKRGTDMQAFTAMLFDKTSLERIFSARLLTVADKKLKYLGVYDIVREWVEWRKGIIFKKNKIKAEEIGTKYDKLEPFVRLIKNEEWKNRLVELVTKHTVQEAREYAMEVLGCDMEIAKGICRYSIESYNKSSKYINDLETLKTSLANALDSLSDEAIAQHILDDMEVMRETVGKQTPRRSEETSIKFNIQYATPENENLNDFSTAIFSLDENGVLTKTQEELEDYVSSHSIINYKAIANSQSVAVTDRSDIIRIYGDEFGYSSTEAIDLVGYSGAVYGSKILMVAPAKGMEYLFILKNGFVSYFNPKNFESDKLRIRLLSTSLNSKVGENMIGFEQLENDYSTYSLIAMEETGKIAVFNLADLPKKTEKGVVRLPDSQNKEVVDYLLAPTEFLRNYMGEDYEFRLNKFDYCDVDYIKEFEESEDDLVANFFNEEYTEDTASYGDVKEDINETLRELGVLDS